MYPLTLKKRADFLCVKNKGNFQKFPYFLVQWCHHSNEVGQQRIGYTASKKVGNAVMRNRAKRRLREVVRLFFKTKDFLTPVDIVLIARTSCTTAPFMMLQENFAKIMLRIENSRPLT